MKHNIIIINGPNLNLLGEREKEKYGEITLKDVEVKCSKYAKDNEMAFAGHGGFNYALSENTYAGLRGSYYQIEGPTDSLGIQYDDVKAWSIGLSIGMKF